MTEGCYGRRKTSDVSPAVAVNYIMRKRHLRTAGFKPNFNPGFYPYKFFYAWMNFALPFAAVPICTVWLLVGYALGRRQ